MRKRQTPQEHFTRAYDVFKRRGKSKNLFEKGSVYLNYIGKFELPEAEEQPQEIGYVRNST